MDPLKKIYCGFKELARACDKYDPTFRPKNPKREAPHA